VTSVGDPYYNKVTMLKQSIKIHRCG